MTDTQNENLLARLAAQGTADDPGPWAALAACEPKHATVETPPAPKNDDKLNELLDRIRQVTEPGATAPEPVERAAKTEVKPTAKADAKADAKSATPLTATADSAQAECFVPLEPKSFAEAQISVSAVEGLVLKLLLSRGDSTGRQVSDHLKLPFRLLDELLRTMKADQLVVHKGSAPMNDYLYQMTDLGRERARRLAEHCTYFGTAPVSLQDYIEAVKAQSLTTQHPTEKDLKHAFDDLLISPRMLRRLGPAINSGRGLFLFGATGNGKTSIAERVTKCFGQAIWIPRAIGVDGEIIRLYDPNAHELMPQEHGNGLLEEGHIDKRWVRIRRPTIVVGGELTMDNLEITLNTSTGTSEAPVQLKSNCGTLVIDDFGRQRMSTDELLNRWIVPLEKRADFLNLANGKKIEVPFDQLVIFSTNLEPKQLVDDAFLRRIPYKIEVNDPTEDEFRDLFKMMAPKLGFDYRDEAVTYLLEHHYRPIKRRMRCCQPRDLLMQVKNMCLYEDSSVAMTNDAMDFAVENYFAVL